MPTESTPVIRSIRLLRLRRREAAERHADQHRPAEAGDGQHQGVRQLLEHDQLGTRPVGEDVGAEIAAQHAAEERRELDEQRLVEAHLRR